MALAFPSKDSTTHTTKFYYDGTKLAAEKKGGTIVWYDYDETGSPMGMRVDGQDYFFQRNAQGDVTGIYDPNGELIVTYTYDSWGKLTEVGGAYSHTIGEYNSLRYRGYYYDADTGLYYANSRYYDPETHRFVNSDTYTSTGQGILGNNMFAYCDYDPINRIDTDGEFWDTIFDVVSLGVSIADVIANPDDPWAWAGLAADVVSLAVPLVSGGGAVVKAVTKADDVADGLKAINMADNAKRGWNVGDDITNLTKAGNEPKWSTVRQRYWKNEAFFNPQQYSDKDLALMKKGRAPLVQSNGKFYPMELHHIEPRHLGGSNAYKILMPVTPWMHAQIDRHRFFVP